MVTVADYLSLVTSEHRGKPRFIAMLTVVLQPVVDAINALQALPALFDLDAALGAQLDAVGLWIGISRQLSVPIADVYFSFNTPALGFNQGTWRGPYDPVTGLEYLPDDAYRNVLRARIASNHWDGSIPGAVSIWETLFGINGARVVISDHQDMSMSLQMIIPGSLDAVTAALLAAGYMRLKPAGVRISAYTAQTPFFGFNMENTVIAGFNVGNFTH